MTLKVTGAAALLALGLAGCSPAVGSRVLSPEKAGMTCPDATLCIEDTARLAQARALRAEGARFVQARFGAFERQPRVLFCTTPECSAKFGMDGPIALTFGTAGIVIGHRGWRDYVIRHEMIHHRQGEVFGPTQTSLVLPKWFIEGAAYALSEDPRRPLPRQDIENWRKQFEAWQAQGKTWRDKP